VVAVFAQGRIISNFALLHFRAAQHFSSMTNQIESSNRGQPLGSFFEQICFYCSSCIIVGAASLEALVNELYLAPGPLQSAIPEFDSYFWGGLEEKRCLRIFRKSRRIKGLEREPALTKYQQALELLGKRLLTRGAPTYQQAEALIGFRNYLIHFKPLWDDQRRNATLEQRLQGRFVESPFVDTGADFLAKRCMSAGAASWVVSTVENFVSEFGRASGLDPQKLGAFK
jgi:hypothetical protein